MKLVKVGHWSLRTKLLTITAAIFVIIALGGGVAVYNLTKIMAFTDGAHDYVSTALSERKGEAAATQARTYQANYERMHYVYRLSLWLTGALLLGMLAVLVVLGNYFARNVTKPLKKLEDAM
ncbi:MAG TPA: hypothetical protein VES91_08740, partial [Burkholderiaceae bacterium]|nr:hypothetical protein [Burkholderiaceae bacterium]